RVRNRQLLVDISHPAQCAIGATSDSAHGCEQIRRPSPLAAARLSRLPRHPAFGAWSWAVRPEHYGAYSAVRPAPVAVDRACPRALDDDVPCARSEPFLSRFRTAVLR